MAIGHCESYILQQSWKWPLINDVLGDPSSFLSTNMVRGPGNGVFYVNWDNHIQQHT